MVTLAARRGFLAGAIGAAAAAGVYPLMTRGARKRRVRRLIIGGAGGALQSAMRAAFFAPFTRDTGIEVVEETYGSLGLARLKAQLREGRAQVDLLDGMRSWESIGRRHGIVDKIEFPEESKRDFLPGAVSEYGFGYATCSFGIVHKAGSNPAPQGWRDFWDTHVFRGRRALYGPVVERHIEYALMADGIPLREVYPLQDAKVDRAFVKLVDIRPAINVWYRTPAECEQLFVGDQIDMGEFFSGRAFFLHDRGVPVRFVWTEAVMNVLTFILAKDAPNTENALAFLRYIGRPEPQAALATAIYYGPTNTAALALIQDQKTLERLPTYPPNLAKQLVLDTDWWAENLDRLAPRWSRLIER